MRLKIPSMVIPIIRKGNRINQKSGKRNNIIRASGQHSTKSIKKSARAINVLTVSNLDSKGSLAKWWPDLNSTKNE
jgi:hypothetical protein